MIKMIHFTIQIIYKYIVQISDKNYEKNKNIAY